MTIATDDKDEGILYTAIGEKFAEEAATSAKRVRDLGIDYPIVLLSDHEPDHGCFDDVIQMDRNAKDRQDWLRARLENLHRTPFKRTLYLDTDTWVVDNDAVSDLFELLSRFDVIAPGEFGRRLDLYRPESDDVLPEVDAPDAFPMFHAGIFGFEKSDETSNLLEKWLSAFKRHVSVWPELQNDQPAFREALYNTDVSIGRFAQEYSFRLPFPQQVVGRVKIIHGRAENYQKVASQLNERTERRICYPIHTNFGHPDGRDVEILTDPGNVERVVKRLSMSVKEQGVVATSQRVGKRVFARLGREVAFGGQR